MQTAYNIYGVDGFEVDILENCDYKSVAHRRTRESVYIGMLRPAFNSKGM
jgi:hypothetical protein